MFPNTFTETQCRYENRLSESFSNARLKPVFCRKIQDFVHKNQHTAEKNAQFSFEATIFGIEIKIS